jgi:serine/threonine-protein phosphatase PGAM5
MQARRTKEALYNYHCQACFSSPISRAKEFAEVIWEGEGTDVILADNLREADLGWLQGMTNQHAADAHPEVYGALRVGASTLHASI